jgi:hypothetical protein
MMPAQNIGKPDPDLKKFSGGGIWYTPTLDLVCSLK